MDKKIYSILNETKTDLAGYEPQIMQEEEINQIMTKLTGNKKKSKMRKFIAAAACAMVVVTAAGATVFSDQVYAGWKAISYDIAGFLGIQKDLEPYTTVVEQSLSKGGITVTLNEVILDKDELIVAFTEVHEERLQEYSPGLSGQIYLNGRNEFTGASGGSEVLDEHTIYQVMHYDLADLDADQEWDIEIVFSESESEGTLKWEFAFHTNRAELAVNTRTIALDYQFTLPEGEIIRLTEFTTNDIGQKIYYTKSKNMNQRYDIQLRGEDNLGNPIEFLLSRGNKEGGRLNLDTYGGMIGAEATSLTLTPYAVKLPEGSGQLSNDFQPVGESFTFDITE